MNAYKIYFKKSATTRKSTTWVRYAETKEQAIESAKKALDEQYYGEAVFEFALPVFYCNQINGFVTVPEA
jgi:hypothetical protein